MWQGQLALMKNSETAEFHFEASIWLAEERLLVLLSNCATVPGHKIKLKPGMGMHAVKILAWIIKFCILYYCHSNIQ